MTPLWNLAFFLTALLYSSAGLGGASAYLAYLSIAGIDYRFVPALALVMSITSTLTSSINWIKYFRRSLIPIVAVSAPAAFIGGKIRLDEKTFDIAVSVLLTFIGATMIAPPEKLIKLRKETDDDVTKKSSKTKKYLLIFIMSPILGFVAGAIGIGGGVFLLPLLYLSGIADEKQAASAGTVFILVNSVFGFIGHIIKLKYVPLDLILFPTLSVILGAFIGSYVSSKVLDPRLVKVLFGLILIFIAVINLL